MEQEAMEQEAMVVRGTEEAASVLAPWERGRAPSIWTTLSPENTLRVINDAIPGGEALDKVIFLTDIVSHEATIITIEGKECKALRTILVDKDHRGFAFVSDGVVNSIGLLCDLLDRRPPFDPPIKVKVVQKPTKRGFRVYRLTLA